MKNGKKTVIKITAFLALVYAVLLIPDTENTNVHVSNTIPFAWNNNIQWNMLEHTFEQAKLQPTALVNSKADTLFASCNKLLLQFERDKDTAILANLTQQYFYLAALIAAVPAKTDSLIQLYNHTRVAIKQQSIYWDVQQICNRQLLYKSLYGLRAATEEVLLQTNKNVFNNVLQVQSEISKTPATNILGMQVHSGDLLISRGGASVSALIARGNDYPGNFSHVAQLYVDESGKAFVIEAHIEKGVAISTVEQYLADKKLRILVLRPRANLPVIIKNGMLPHDAAKYIMQLAASKHIPYDFKMDYFDSTAMFCSEVCSYAYKKFGVQLWQCQSTIASAGIVNWLQVFGVQHFITQMPSDLEYDPQLSIITEWRASASLKKDHLDNAVIDELLQQADAGKKIDYNIFMLPIARCIKGWCIIKNICGSIGIIPEGMTATQALKNESFEQMNVTLKTKAIKLADNFMIKNKYYPPYWKLISICKEAANQ